MFEYRELTEGVLNILKDGKVVGQFYASTGNLPLVRRVSEAGLQQVKLDLACRGLAVNAVTPPPPEIPEVHQR